MIKNLASFNVTIEPELKIQLDKIADKKDLHRSQVIRRMLHHVLKNRHAMHQLFGNGL